MVISGIEFKAKESSITDTAREYKKPLAIMQVTCARYLDLLRITFAVLLVKSLMVSIPLVKKDLLSFAVSELGLSIELNMIASFVANN